MKKFLIISFICVATSMNAGIFDWVPTNLFSGEKKVDLPGGTYKNNCSGCTATENKSGLFTLKCNSCKKSRASSSNQHSLNPSITYKNPKTIFSSDVDGKLVESNALVNMFVGR